MTRVRIPLEILKAEAARGALAVTEVAHGHSILGYILVSIGRSMARRSAAELARPGAPSLQPGAVGLPRVRVDLMGRPLGAVLRFTSRDYAELFLEANPGVQRA